MMNNKRKEELSRFISLILRHKPEVIDINLDTHGYANVKQLIRGINENSNHTITFEILEDIVNTDNKGRYSFNEGKTKIRANQGHSIKVDVELKKATPPDCLYHGTAKHNLNSILENGIKSMSRLYVHLSDNFETAEQVGSRHGDTVVLTINTKEMINDGYVFYLSKNGVWLTDHVPSCYISL